MSTNDVNNFLPGFGGCELTLDDLLGLDSEFLIDSMDELLQQQPEQHAEHHMLQLEKSPPHELDNLDFMLELPTDLMEELLFEPAHAVLNPLHDLDNLEFMTDFPMEHDDNLDLMPDIPTEHLPELLFEPAESSLPEPQFIVLEGDEEKKIHPFFNKSNKKRSDIHERKPKLQPEPAFIILEGHEAKRIHPFFKQFNKK